jgi:hypothetical protein
MKTLIKIVIGLAVLAACVNVGRALMNDYQFQDAVKQGLLFNPRAEDAVLIDMVMKTAAEYEIPIEKDGVTVRMQGQDLHIDMTYTTNVTVLPGVFATDWTFNPSASTRILTGSRR